MKGEALAVESGGHQRQQQRRRADQRPDGEAQFMGAAHQQGAGVGHCRAAGLRHQADIVAGAHRRDKSLDVGGGRRFRQLLDRQFAQGHGMADALEFGARRLGVFDDKTGQPASGFTGDCRQIVLPGRVAEGDGQQPEGAGHRLAERARHGRPVTASAGLRRAACRTGRSAAGPPARWGRRRAGRRAGKCPNPRIWRCRRN